MHSGIFSFVLVSWLLLSGAKRNRNCANDVLRLQNVSQDLELCFCFFFYFFFFSRLGMLTPKSQLSKVSRTLLTQGINLPVPAFKSGTWQTCLWICYIPLYITANYQDINFSGQGICLSGFRSSVQGEKPGKVLLDIYISKKSFHFKGLLSSNRYFIRKFQPAH